MDNSTVKMQQHRPDDVRQLFYHDKCDRYDYLIAVGCGAIAGIVDIFLVGSPGDSVLGAWTDKQVDNAVMAFAKKMGWKPQEKNKGNVRSAIGYLERNYKVNYDQRKTSDVGGLFTMAPNTHHMMSLAHSPDIVGLFFSVLNQFTSTSSFVANGQIITINSETFELEGGNFVAKIFCGIANWFTHLMSDVAGSSGSHNRGTGIVMPFYELFGLCDFGSFNTEDGKQTVAELAQSVFVKGYDARFAATMAIPVVMCDLSIRLCWALRQYFGRKKPLKECIPSYRHDDLRLMLIIGDGTLCLMDGVDAAVRSGGNWVAFFLRLNIVAWCRLIALVIKEVCIRLGIMFPLDAQVNAFVCVNEAIKEYAAELEKIDIQGFIADAGKLSHMDVRLLEVSSEDDLCRLLLQEYEALGIDTPWVGDFDDFMSNPANKLVFE